MSNEIQNNTKILTSDSATGDLLDPRDFKIQDIAAVLSQLIRIRCPFNEGPHNIM